ncbi:Hap43p-repressed protein [Candida albicans P78042]|nr:Hap43p-repressed protein [Candida albicans P78042]
MTILSTDIDLFQEIAELPSEIIDLIVGYLPKCMLPKLLYFPSIQKEVAFTILSDVYITKGIYRHKGSSSPHVGYSECDCNRFKVALNNLEKGIAQWNVYPRAIHMDGKFVFRDVLDNFPKLLRGATSIDGTLSSCEGSEAETLLNSFLDSNITFDFLRLVGFWDPFTLPPVATSIRLFDTILNNYVIPGVKKVDIYSDTSETPKCTFSSDLEDLQIEDQRLTEVTLPPNLRKLCIFAQSGSMDFKSAILPALEYLSLELRGVESINNSPIIAPNLKVLNLSMCLKRTYLDTVRQYQHLKLLRMHICVYPFGLFNEGAFPELERFEYDGYGYEDSDDFKSPILTFPSNLKQLSIEFYDSVIVNLNNLMLPPTLIRLELLKLTFNDGYFHLGENLQYVHIKTSRLAFESSFRIPHLAGELILEADYLTFESPEFMYHLPNSLTRLHLIANKQGEMSPIVQKIRWPLVLGDFVFENFNIDYHTLKLMNLNESRLEKISICGGGGIKKLDVDLFPISVKGLALVEMRIHELPASFKRLNNLRQLSLMGNQLSNVNSVKLPVLSLDVLNVRQCNLRLISPFLVSMLEEKNQNANLRVEATGNLNVNINDVRRVMKAIKGLSLELNRLNDSILKISNHSYRLEAVYRDFDPYFETPQSSETEEVVSDYDSDDLYNGSVFYSDEEYSDDEDDDNKRKKN